VNLKDGFVSAEAPVEHKEIVKAEKPEDTKSEASNESKASISTPVTEKSKLAPPPSKRSRYVNYYLLPCQVSTLI
jgi:hypothetical protein